MPARFIAFCGGFLDGQIASYDEVISSLWMPVADYKWSQERIPAFDDEAWVFHFKGQHECKGDDMTQSFAGPSLLEQLVVELDEGLYKLLNDEMSQEEALKLKSYLRGIAYTVSKFMQGYYKTADDVVTEVAKRYEMRVVRGEQSYESPGLGTRRYENVRASKYAMAKDLNEVPLHSAEEKVKHNLTDQQVIAVRNARSSGKMGDDEICSIFKITPTVLRAVCR